MKIFIKISCDSKNFLCTMYASMRGKRRPGEHMSKLSKMSSSSNGNLGGVCGHNSSVRVGHQTSWAGSNNLENEDKTY